MGDVEDFKHFLPRILELYVRDIENAPYDVGVLFSKLDYAHWNTWHEVEHNAVAKTIDAWLQDLQNSKSEKDSSILEEVMDNLYSYELNYKAQPRHGPYPVKRTIFMPNG